MIKSNYDLPYSKKDYSPNPTISLPINSCFVYKESNKDYILNSSTILLEKGDTEYIVSKFNKINSDITISIQILNEETGIAKLIEKLYGNTAITRSTPALDYFARGLLQNTNNPLTEQFLINFLNYISDSGYLINEQIKINYLVHKQINQSKEFIHSNYSEEIKIHDIAEAAHMSVFHFSRVFKNITGFSPYDYLISLRIEKAKELLLKGESITQTAFGTGFNSLANFSYRFKELTNHSPMEYLKCSNRLKANYTS